MKFDIIKPELYLESFNINNNFDINSYCTLYADLIREFISEYNRTEINNPNPNLYYVNNSSRNINIGSTTHGTIYYIDIINNIWSSYILNPLFVKEDFNSRFDTTVLKENRKEFRTIQSRVNLNKEKLPFIILHILQHLGDTIHVNTSFKRLGRSINNIESENLTSIYDLVKLTFRDDSPPIYLSVYDISMNNGYTEVLDHVYYNIYSRSAKIKDFLK